MTVSSPTDGGPDDSSEAAVSGSPSSRGPAASGPPSSGAPVATRPRLAVIVLLAVLAVVAFTVDRITKSLVLANLTEGVDRPVLGRVLVLRFVENPGAAFSLASGSTWIFSILATAVVLAIVWFSRRIRSLPWAVFFGLLLGGTLGNLFDRLFRPPSFGTGHVVDFIYLPWILPAIFNVADICIVSAMGLFVLLTLRGSRIDGTRDRRDASAEDSAAGAADSAPSTE